MNLELLGWIYFGCAAIISCYGLFAEQSRSYSRFQFILGEMIITLVIIPVIDVIVLPLSTLFQPGYLMTYLKRILLRSKVKKYPNSIPQKFLNSRLEPLDLQYSSLLTPLRQLWATLLMWFGFMPSTSLIFLFSMVILYWVNKYIVLRRSKEPRKCSGDISLSCFRDLRQGFYMLMVSSELTFS